MKDLNRSIGKLTLIGILVITILAIPLTCLVAATSLEEIMGDIKCTCGCNMVLEDCNCNTAKDMINQIRQQIIDGKSGDEIIAEFQRIYGDIILVTPPKSGLELILWVLPIITSVMGTIVIYENTQGKEPFPTSEIKAPIAEVDFKNDSKQIDVELAKYEKLFDAEYEHFKKVKK